MGYTCAPPLYHCTALPVTHYRNAWCALWRNYRNRTAKVQKIIDISTILGFFSAKNSAFLLHYVEK